MKGKTDISLAVFGYSVAQVNKEIDEYNEAHEIMAEAFFEKKKELTEKIEAEKAEIAELEDILREQNNQESLVKLAEDTLDSRLDLLARAAFEDKKKIEADFILQARELSQRGKALNQRIADCKTRFHQVLNDVYSIKELRESDEKNVSRHIRRASRLVRAGGPEAPAPVIKPVEPRPVVKQDYTNKPVTLEPEVKDTVIELPIAKPKKPIPETTEAYSSADALAKSIISAVKQNPNSADRLLANRRKKTEVVKNPFEVEISDQPEPAYRQNPAERVYNDPKRLSETWILKYRYLCGKFAGSDLYSRDGKLIIGKDEPITQACAISAANAGMLDKLVRYMY